MIFDAILLLIIAAQFIAAERERREHAAERKRLTDCLLAQYAPHAHAQVAGHEIALHQRGQPEPAPRQPLPDGHGPGQIVNDFSPLLQ